MTTKSKDLVKLRQRKRSNGSYALYFETNINGTRKYEYLKLYLIPEKTKDDKAKNRETLQFAETLRAKRIMELQAARLGFVETVEHGVLLYDYLQTIIDRKAGTTKTSWENCREHMLRYDANMKLKLEDITRKWVEGFRKHLDEAKQWDIDTRKRNVKPVSVSESTKALMFQKFCSIFNLAVKEGLITHNPTLAVERFKEEENEREFLTVDELRCLATVPPPTPVVGRAFFFSCLTGLRWSDIVKLTWGDVQVIGEVTRIVFRQQKTSSLEHLDINVQAVQLMGERSKSTDLVFQGLSTAQYARIAVSAWVRSAGIDKHITFHCARHTFAVMMLDLGVDLYTVSKLLGHKSIETTQIYAKILDKNKQAAVTRIPNIF